MCGNKLRIRKSKDTLKIYHLLVFEFYYLAGFKQFFVSFWMKGVVQNDMFWLYGFYEFLQFFGVCVAAAVNF